MVNPNNNFFDILNLASLLVGIQNLNENREQSAHNDIQSANQSQAEFLLKEIKQQFATQHDLLKRIAATLDRLQSKLEQFGIGKE